MNAFVAMLRLTLRELWARKITMGLFLVSTLVWLLLSFTLNLDIVEGSIAGIRILGNEAGPPQESVVQSDGSRITEILSLETFVATIQSVVAGISYWAAALLGIFAAAPLLPGLLARGQADLLFSKPAGRLTIFAGHLAGVAVCVFLLALYLFGMIALVLFFKTGVFTGYLVYSVLTVLAMFMVMYAVVSLVAVTTESAALSLIVTYGLILASLAFLFKDQIEPQINRPWRSVYTGLYHILPNFAEVTKLVAQFAGTDGIATWYPLISSITFGLVVYAFAGWRLMAKDF